MNGPGRAGPGDTPAAHGFLLVDKPPGLSSHDVVAQVRRAHQYPRVGHLGTLDPAAHGLLPLAIGLATRLTVYAQGHDKQYRTVWQLGQETDTGDQQGRVIAQSQPGCTVSTAQVREVLSRFEGEIEQVPPAVSAVRVRGRHSYEWARAGQPQPLPARRVRVARLAWLGWRLPGVDGPWQPPSPEPTVVIPAGSSLWLELDCSAGTYVRALARDSGRALGLGATVADLCRTRVGPFRLEQAHPLDEILAADPLELRRWLLPLDAALPRDWPRWVADRATLERVQHGNPFVVKGLVRAGQTSESGLLLVLDESRRLWALARPVRQDVWQPSKVFLWEEDEESAHDEK